VIKATRFRATKDPTRWQMTIVILLIVAAGIAAAYLLGN
jgi:uncharacterized membrane protein YhdT